MTPDTATALVKMLSLGFPGARFGADHAHVYEGAIADLEGPETQAAIETLIKNSPHFPKAAEIRAEVMSQRRERTRLADASAHRGRPSGARDDGGPTASQWAAVLPGMLERDARHRKLMAQERRLRGLAPREVELCPFLEMARRGARGENVLPQVKALLAASSGVGK